jgi:hypothetical protein
MPIDSFSKKSHKQSATRATAESLHQLLKLGYFLRDSGTSSKALLP